MKTGKFIKIAAAFLMMILFAQKGYGSEVKQYQHAVTIGGNISGTVIIVGLVSDDSKIQQLINYVVDMANEANNAVKSDIGKLNSAEPGTSIQVSWQTAELLSKGKKISEWTSTDILSAENSTGSHKDISVDEKGRSVSIKKAGIKINPSPIISGYLADILIRYINSAGMQNAMVRVGNVFRGMGSGTHSPWKIQVQEDSSTYAKHALNIIISDSGAATVSSTQFPGQTIFDADSGKNIPVKCKGSTIIMSEAVYADGVAYSMMILGPEKGIKTLADMKSARGLIVDKAGKFIRQGL